MYHLDKHDLYQSRHPASGRNPLTLWVLFAVSFAVVLGWSTMAAAASSQIPEQTDSADITISLSISPSLQIETVNQVNLDITNRKVDAQFSESFCVRGTGAGRYRIIAYGTSNADRAFVLSNHDGQELVYQVDYRGDASDGDFSPLLPGIPSREYQVVQRGSACSENTAFQVTFKSTDLMAAQSGLYRGSLTLLVSPV